jgi:hypothetical protein
MYCIYCYVHKAMQVLCTHAISSGTSICTRWFKYDQDYLCVNKSQFVPVIFEPPCTRTVTFLFLWILIFITYKSSGSSNRLRRRMRIVLHVGVSLSSLNNWSDLDETSCWKPCTSMAELLRELCTKSDLYGFP